MTTSPKASNLPCYQRSAHGHTLRGPIKATGSKVSDVRPPNKVSVIPAEPLEVLLLDVDNSTDFLSTLSGGQFFCE